MLTEKLTTVQLMIVAQPPHVWHRTTCGLGTNRRWNWAWRQSFRSRQRLESAACITLSCTSYFLKHEDSPPFCNVQTRHVFYVIQAKSGVTGFVVVARLRGEELDTASDWMTHPVGAASPANQPHGQAVTLAAGSSPLLAAPTTGGPARVVDCRRLAALEIPASSSSETAPNGCS